MNSFIYLVYLAITVYAWMIVARAVLSWFPLRSGGMMSRIYRVLWDATEPYVALFRRVIPTARLGATGLDLSPAAALLVLFIVMQVLVRL